MSTNSDNDESNSLLNNQINSETKNNLGHQDFLRLMVAQIQNQDSMQPQVNGKFLSQFAQFGSNDGIATMKESLHKMATSLQSNQALQASALVGRKVLVNSDILQLSTVGDVTAAVDVPFHPGYLSASICSESGRLIKIISLGQPEPGLFQFSWDGTGDGNKRMKEGQYKIEVHAAFGEQKISLKTMISANVDSVNLGQNGEGLKLNVSGIGPISLDQVRQISV